MVNQRHCPFCKVAATDECPHLALACEGRHFVRQCVEHANAQKQWEELCTQRRQQNRLGGNWSPEQEDFTWLETAFCDAFLKGLTWFGGMEHEWRTGPAKQQGTFWVLIWSKNPRKLWWELRDEFERQSVLSGLPLKQTGPGLEQFNLYYRR